MGVLTLDQLVQHVQEIPALPDVAIKVLHMADDPTASARDISGLIASDMALTSRVLKIANSAYYGMSRSVSTVSEAVLILGMQAVRNLSLAASAYDTLNRQLDGYHIPAGSLWQHSTATSLAAQIIAKRSGIVRPEEAFVAGLMHDIGKVVLHVHVAAQCQAILALVDLDSMHFHEAEKFILGFDHAEVGARVGEKWNLPPSLCSAIAGHHCLENSPEARELAAVVSIANAVCVMHGFGAGYEQKSLFIQDALDIVKLTEDDLESVVNELSEQMHRYRELFQTGKG